MSESPKTRETDLVVIGAGPGGYTAAFMAADHGRKVTLVDIAEQLGGVCLNCGCIPSKTLLHMAHLVSETRQAADRGVVFQPPAVDLDKLRAWKNEVISRNASGLRQLAKARKVEIVRARARFIGTRTLQVAEAGGDQFPLAFNHAVIATGSSPATIPGLSIESHRMMDSTAALDLAEIPGSLLVIGGGYIGLEIGTIYAALGSRVTVVEMMPDLLFGADRDLVRILHNRLKKTFSSILLNSKVVSLTDTGRGISATIATDGAACPVEQVYDRVLLAVGRTPNSGGLDLGVAGIEVDDRGFIRVDEQRRTTNERVLAVGDVAGGLMLAHKAAHEARVAAETLAGRDTRFAPAAVPCVVFTDPEIAWAGLTATEASEKGIPCETAKFPWAASGRAASIGRTDGLTKILVSPEDKRILGIGIVGSGAGELLAEGVLAIETKATARDVARCIHAHPTLSETIGEAAESACGTTPHIVRPQR
ncbi:MAG: dihydrolipoyl dehydrogenase [Planctomycetes bacterium]|nr:dihydrolipoyl dehydrogenase [Planctomycetota bacterium]